MQTETERAKTPETRTSSASPLIASLPFPFPVSLLSGLGLPLVRSGSSRPHTSPPVQALSADPLCLVLRSLAVAFCLRPASPTSLAPLTPLARPSN